MRNLTLIYVLALTIIACVIGVSQYLVQKSISESRYDSRTINISGQQGMLSQKITKAALSMETADAPEPYDKSKSELKAAADLWELSHNALQYGSKGLQLNDVNNSEKTLLHFLEVEPHFTAMESAVDELINLPYSTDSTKRAQLSGAIDVLQKNEGPFLRIMNEITLDYDNESTSRVQELSRTEYILLFIALALLILEGFLIFRPAIKRIQDYTQKLIQHEQSLESALEEQKKEKAKVDYLNTQAKTVFDNVKQGLFLLDNTLTISELHSKVMEDIMDTQNLGGKSFAKIMKPRLVKRDFEALSLFMKHLFNPDVNDTVLAKLNPISHVEIHNTDDTHAQIESKHLSFSFARVRSGKEIQNVLVNATDETKGVLMQKQIQESEERNKRESEQLLSILRVDPVLLNEFLKRAKLDLNGISARYELDTNQEFSELLNYTFNVIHNLKGNASMIELVLVSERLHKMEEIIVGLRAEEEIEGENFLKILYQINELIKIIDNMERMMTRIVEVNDQLTASEKVDKTNTSLINTLNQGLEKLSKEMSQPVTFHFNDHDIAIPKKYHLSLRDLFIQLFRNSLAHGIEDEFDRDAMGKNPKGKISIELSLAANNHFSLQYSDDGRGVNINRVVKKAIELNLITEEKSAKMNEDDKIKLLFEAGFSTARETSQFAGRGQGLNLISDIIEDLNGNYTVSSQPGKGFSISIILPLTIEQKVSQII